VDFTGKMSGQEPVKWEKRFYAVAVGQSVFLVGSNAVQFILVWWVTKGTDSAIMVALTGIFTYSPQIVLGPLVGVWLDRLKRKTVLLWADVFTGIVAAVFALAFFFGEPPYWAACAVLGIRAIAGVFSMPAIQAIVPLLVPPEQLVKANSVQQFLQTGSSVLGPVIGAAVYAAWPMECMLLVEIAVVAAACIIIGMIKLPEVTAGFAKSPFFTEIKEGAKEYVKDRKLFLTTVFTMLCMVFLMPLVTLYPLLISGVFKGNEWHVSGINAAFSAGMIAGAVIIGAFNKKVKNKLYTVMSGLLLFGAASVLCGILPRNAAGLLLLFGICFVMGVGVNIYTVPYLSYIQEKVPKNAQGRVFSLYYSVFNCTMPLGLLFAGPIADTFGVAVYFTIAGVAALIIVSTGMIMTAKTSRTAH
jgi:DHA3 family macrolide efflux protein-like MFS transporter